MKDVLNVESVDFNVAANAKAHRTSDYAIVESVWKPKLVVRRGQSFDVTIEFNRKYDKSKDDLRLIFEMGKFTKLCILCGYIVSNTEYDLTF